MSLQVSQQLGSYEVTSLIGKGGMIEVYRANSVRISMKRFVRSVCLILMVLPSAVAQHISVGVKAGVPLTDVVEPSPVDVPFGAGLFSAETKHYTIGPVIDIE